ncbi:MAG: PqqD family protein [Bacteroidales bacterium]|nr:PqqD family protein [Candidatus Colimorpha merdihippi]MCQ2282464.1 PqqD family protein [Bacteroidales bacterium]
MKINPIYKVRKVAGENIILLQGKSNGDMTRVIAFNASALLMWESLQGKDFTVDDAVAVLMDNYDVEEAVARHDAEAWVANITENGLLLGK